MVCFDCVHCKVCSLHKRYNEPCDYYEERKKKGKWRKRNGYVYDHRCSCCEYIIYNEKTNFCPNCGADMRGDV